MEHRCRDGHHSGEFTGCQAEPCRDCSNPGVDGRTQVPQAVLGPVVVAWVREAAPALPGTGSGVQRVVRAVFVEFISRTLNHPAIFGRFRPTVLRAMSTESARFPRTFGRFRQISGDANRLRLDVRQCLPRFDQLWSSSTEVGCISEKRGADSTEVGQDFAKFQRVPQMSLRLRPNFARNRPNLRDFGRTCPMFATSGPISTKFGRCQSNFARAQPIWARIGPHLGEPGRTRPIFWPTLAEIRLD